MNPVLRDSLEVFFREGHGLPPYFYLLAFLAPIEFLALCTPFLGAQMWSGPGNLVRILTSVAVVLAVYFALRVANRSTRRGGSSRSRTGSRAQAAGRGRRERPVGVSRRACRLLAAADRAPADMGCRHLPRGTASLALVLALIPFYALCYGVWGLAALALWEGKQDNRELIVRCFIGVVVLVSMAVYLPLNPVAYLLAVLAQHEPDAIYPRADQVAGRQLPFRVSPGVRRRRSGRPPLGARNGVLQRGHR